MKDKISDEQKHPPLIPTPPPPILGQLARGARGLGAYAFLIGVWLAVPYFNWKVANEKGFWEWLCCGEFVPTMRAMAWPAYAYSWFNSTPEWSEDDKANIAHFVKALQVMKEIDDVMQGTEPN